MWFSGFCIGMAVGIVIVSVVNYIDSTEGCEGMNRYDVVQTIREIGNEFGRVMACLQSKDYVAGYEQAVKDMVHLFEYKPAVAAERPEAKRVVLFGGTRGRRYEST